MPSEVAETSTGPPEELGFSPEAKKLEGLELIQSQVERLSGLIQKEVESDEPNTADEEEEFQGYMRKWVAEYKRFAQADPEHQPEALEILGMIRTLLGDLPIEEGLLPGDVYNVFQPESPAEKN